MPGGTDPAFASLSAVESAQLGKPRILAGGGESVYRVVPASHWPRVRQLLLERGRGYVPGLQAELTAYTPGETLRLLENPVVRDWHARMAGFVIPRPVQAVALVPCARAKPWAGRTAGSYGGYNRVRQEAARGEIASVYFVTISEPLGVIPECLWGDFPAYDNPGLFRDDYLRSGLKDADWFALARRWGDLPEGKYVLPFDLDSYRQAVRTLGAVLASFVAANERAHGALRYLSFVDMGRRPAGTHEEILDAALERLAFLRPQDRHRKGPKGSSNRYRHVAGVLAGL